MASKRWLGMAMPIMTAALLAGCAGTAQAPTGNSGSSGNAQQPAPAGGPAGATAITDQDPITGKMTGDPKYGGTFRTYQPASAIAPHLDPHQTVTYAVHRVGAGVVFNRLLSFNTWADGDRKTSVLEPDLAESWKLMSDNVTYEFKLRQGVKWQNVPPMNGREMVADDVIYSLKRQGTPGFANASQVNDIAVMEAPDKYTLRIKLKEPNAGFLFNVADGHSKIVPREVVEQKGDLKNGPLIGTGAFILEDGWTRSTGYKLKKNPDYFKKDAKGNKLPYLDNFEIVILGDNSAVTAAMLSGQLSEVWAFLQEPELQDLKKNKPDLIFDRRPSIGSFTAVDQHLGFKADKPPFNDVRVRQAFDKAVDRQEIIDAAAFGKAVMAVALQLPSEDWMIPQKELAAYWKQDTAEAKKLLADAGYPNGLDVEMTSKVDPQQSTIAELLVAQVSKAGFRVKIKPIDNPTYADAVLTSGTFQFYNGTGLGSADPNIDLYRFYHSKSKAGNTAGVNDPKLDEMIDKQRAEADVEKRKGLLKDIQWYIVKNAWYTQLYTNRPAALRAGNVRNYSQGCCYDYSHWEHVWLDK